MANRGYWGDVVSGIEAAQTMDIRQQQADLLQREADRKELEFADNEAFKGEIKQAGEDHQRAVSDMADSNAAIDQQIADSGAPNTPEQKAVVRKELGLSGYKSRPLLEYDHSIRLAGLYEKRGSIEAAQKLRDTATGKASVLALNAAQSGNAEEFEEYANIFPNGVKYTGTRFYTGPDGKKMFSAKANGKEVSGSFGDLEDSLTRMIDPKSVYAMRGREGMAEETRKMREQMAGDRRDIDMMRLSMMNGGKGGAGQSRTSGAGAGGGGDLPASWMDRFRFKNQKELSEYMDSSTKDVSTADPITGPDGKTPINQATQRVELGRNFVDIAANNPDVVSPDHAMDLALKKTRQELSTGAKIPVVPSFDEKNGGWIGVQMIDGRPVKTGTRFSDEDAISELGKMKAADGSPLNMGDQIAKMNRFYVSKDAELEALDQDPSGVRAKMMELKMTPKQYLAYREKIKAKAEMASYEGAEGPSNSGSTQVSEEAKKLNSRAASGRVTTDAQGMPYTEDEPLNVWGRLRNWRREQVRKQGVNPNAVFGPDESESIKNRTSTGAIGR